MLIDHKSASAPPPPPLASPLNNFRLSFRARARSCSGTSPSLISTRRSLHFQVLTSTWIASSSDGQALTLFFCPTCTSRDTSPVDKEEPPLLHVPLGKEAVFFFRLLSVRLQRHGIQLASFFPLGLTKTRRRQAWMGAS